MRRSDERLKRVLLVQTRLRGERLYLRDLAALIDESNPRMMLAQHYVTDADRHLRRAEKAIDEAVNAIRTDNHAGA